MWLYQQDLRILSRKVLQRNPRQKHQSEAKKSLEHYPIIAGLAGFPSEEEHKDLL